MNLPSNIIDRLLHSDEPSIRWKTLVNVIGRDAQSQEATQRAAEIFLKRRLYKRQKGGGVIADDFVTLHYPCYWRYDILFGLKVMAEAGLINDARCHAALDVLEAQQLADGGCLVCLKSSRAAHAVRIILSGPIRSFIAGQAHLSGAWHRPYASHRARRGRLRL